MLTLVKPARGHITQMFGARQIDGNPHAGQDYAYTNGTEIFPEIYAAADGVVLFAGDARGLAWPNIMYLNPDFDRTDGVDSSAGNYTIIAHFDAAGNRIALTGYGHQEQIWVKAGDRVRAGQQIGVIGATGFSNGKHLHFDLVLAPFDVDDAPYYGRVDPNPYISTLASAGTITPQEDDMTPEQIAFMFEQLKSLVDNVATKTDLEDQSAETPGKVWSYKNPSLGTSDAFQILRDAVAGTDRLADKLATAAAGSAAGGASVEQIKDAVKAALREGVA